MILVQPLISPVCCLAVLVFTPLQSAPQLGFMAAEERLGAEFRDLLPGDLVTLRMEL